MPTCVVVPVQACSQPANYPTLQTDLQGAVISRTGTTVDVMLQHHWYTWERRVSLFVFS